MAFIFWRKHKAKSGSISIYCEVRTNTVNQAGGKSNVMLKSLGVIKSSDKEPRDKFLNGLIFKMEELDLPKTEKDSLMITVNQQLDKQIAILKEGKINE